MTLLTPLTEDQVEVISILKQALELAQDGKIDTIGIVVCLPEGPAHLIGGTRAAELYIATGRMMREILERTDDPDRVKRRKVASRVMRVS